MITKFTFTSLSIKDRGHSFFQEVKQAAIMKREYRLYSRKFSMDLYFKKFVVQTVTKMVKYEALKYF